MDGSAIALMIFSLIIFYSLLYFVIKAAVRDAIIEVRKGDFDPPDIGDGRHIAQVTCPECGMEYDMDYPRCPHCRYED